MREYDGDEDSLEEMKDLANTIFLVNLGKDATCSAQTNTERVLLPLGSRKI